MGNIQFQLLEQSPQGNTPLPIPKFSNQKPGSAKNDSKWWCPPCGCRARSVWGTYNRAVFLQLRSNGTWLCQAALRYGIIILKKNSKLHVYIKTRHSRTVFSAMIPDHNSFFFLLGVFFKHKCFQVFPGATECLQWCWLLLQCYTGLLPVTRELRATESHSSCNTGQTDKFLPLVSMQSPSFLYH